MDVGAVGGWVGAKTLAEDTTKDTLCTPSVSKARPRAKAKDIVTIADRVSGGRRTMACQGGGMGASERGPLPCEACQDGCRAAARAHVQLERFLFKYLWHASVGSGGFGGKHVSD